MRLKLNKLNIENFKGIKKLTIDFGDTTSISGQNASGKTSIMDALCWLLFGKDSQDREKFEIRELDANGDKVHNTEIMVEGTFDLDGKPIVFKKTQKENWVKKRGSENPTLQGNVNEMEINGYPMSDTDYREKVSNIITDDTFKILTNPMHFASLPWKEQRNMLMQFVADVDDAERAKNYGKEFEELIPDLEFASSTDDIQKKYSKSMKELKDKQNEIPVRIDELAKSKSDADVQGMTEKRDSLEGRLAELDNQIESSSVDTSDIQARINTLKAEISDFEDNARKSMRNELEGLKSHEYALRQAELDKSQEINSTKKNIEWKKAEQSSVLAHTKDIKVKFEEVKAWAFDENDAICSLCGQRLPEYKVDKLKVEFEQKRSAEIEKLKEQGNKGNETYKGLGEEIAELEADLDSLNKDLEKIKADHNDIKGQVAEAEKKSEEFDLSSDETHQKKVEALNEAISELEKVRENTSDTSSLKTEKEKLQAELKSVIEQIAIASKNNDIDHRIEELRAEQKDVAQKVADNERMIYLLEKFVKQKMEDVSESINKQFETVGFKLFSVQINGGIKECCEMTVNGVPYASLNSGHRIVGGMDVIKALQGLLDAYVPIWIDNAESVNDYNLPKVDSQIILLKVTDEKELNIGG